MKQNGYGYTPTNWLLRVQDLWLCFMFLIPTMAKGGIYCFKYALISSAFEWTFWKTRWSCRNHSDSCNNMQCFIDDSNASKRKGMNNFNECKDAKPRWLSAERAPNSLRQVSVTSCDKRNLTKYSCKFSQKKMPCFDIIVQMLIQTSNHP